MRCREYAEKSSNEILVTAKVALSDSPDDNVLIEAGSLIEAGGSNSDVLVEAGGFY